MSVRVDIVLPCFNPPAGWQVIVADFCRFIGDRYRPQFIIVDDGSTTGNVQESVIAISQLVPVTLIKLEKNRGKGFALRRGVKHCTADFILYTDIDLPFTPESMERVMTSLTARECDIAAGARNQAYYEGTMSAFRRRLSKTFRFFMKRILKVTISDTQCGLKGFNEKGKTLFLRTRINRYLFDFEFIYSALRQPHVRVKAIDVDLRENVVFSRMKWAVLVRESLNLLRVLITSGSR